MRISFDLDDTLICYDPQVPREPNRVPFWAKRWHNEPLRLGAVELFRELRAQGHSLHIYTTSLRQPRQVKRWLRFYKIEVESVINQELHERVVGRRFNSYVSKHPPAFNIDLHVDDLEGVAQEGHERGFAVVIMNQHDREWTTCVREAVIKQARALAC